MKLKKIASLALAGVMAVSMLAGCATKAPETNGETEPVVNSTAVVDAVNNGQGANNKVKVTFTDDSVLDKGLSGAVAAWGTASFDASKMANTITYMTGIKSDLFSTKYNGTYANWTTWASKLGLMADTDTATSATYNTTAVNVMLTYDENGVTPVQDGDTFTVLKVGTVAAQDESSAAKQIAAAIDTDLATLAASTYDSQKEAKDFADGDKYIDYSYAGNVAMTSYTSAYGVTAYYYAYVLTQTVNVKTASL